MTDFCASDVVRIAFLVMSAMAASNYHSIIGVIMVWKQIQSEFGGEDINCTE